MKVESAMPNETKSTGSSGEPLMVCLGPKPAVIAPPAAISAAPGCPSAIPAARQTATARTKYQSVRKEASFQL